MKHIKIALLTVILIAAGLFLFDHQKMINQKLNFYADRASQKVELYWQKAVHNDANQASSKKRVSNKQTGTSISSSATPVESIVKNVSLSKKYYYQYTSKTPATVRAVFDQAIADYNATGIVHLVKGKGHTTDNRVTFSVYSKKMANLEQQTIELGEGGPTITKGSNLSGDYAFNHGSAKLNIYYAKSIRKSVALHELGHALGLDHSDSFDSVMYPMDRGTVQLSPEDLAGLKSIYK
ncbi:M57 family metalloprotease [Paucilactobacillus sp. N302-9]